MKVKFKREWFGPDGFRRRPNMIHDLPESFRKHLPKGATVFDDAPTEDEPAPEPVNARAVSL